MGKNTFFIVILTLGALIAVGCGGGSGANPLGNGGVENALISSQDSLTQNAPTSFRASVAGVGKVELRWRPLEPAEVEDEEVPRVEYRIYRRQDEEQFFQEIAQVDTNYYLDQDLDNGAT